MMLGIGGQIVRIGVGDGIDAGVVRPGGGRGDRAVFDERANQRRDHVGRHDGVGVQQDHGVVFRVDCSQHPEVHVARDAEVPRGPVVPEAEIGRHLAAAFAPARCGAGVVEHQDVSGMHSGFQPCQRREARADELLAVVDEQRDEDPPGRVRHGGHCGPPRFVKPIGTQPTTASAPVHPVLGVLDPQMLEFAPHVDELLAGLDQALGQVDHPGRRHLGIDEGLRQRQPVELLLQNFLHRTSSGARHRLSGVRAPVRGDTER